MSDMTGQMKNSASKSLSKIPNPAAVPAAVLHAVAPPIPDQVQRLHRRVQRDHVRDDDGQAADAHSDVDGLAMQDDLQPEVGPVHGCLTSISMIFVIASIVRVAQIDLDPLGKPHVQSDGHGRWWPRRRPCSKRCYDRRNLACGRAGRGLTRGLSPDRR